MCLPSPGRMQTMALKRSASGFLSDDSASAPRSIPVKYPYTEHNQYAYHSCCLQQERCGAQFTSSAAAGARLVSPPCQPMRTLDRREPHGRSRGALGAQGLRSSWPCCWLSRTFSCRQGRVAIPESHQAWR